MNILMVNPNVTVGGAQKVMLYLGKGLMDRGHRVYVYTTCVDLTHLPPFAGSLHYLRHETSILRPGGELANNTAIDNLGLLAARLVLLRRGIVRAIKEHAIDLVNPHNPPANWLCSFLPVPVVWSCHNKPMAFFKNLRRGYSPLWPSKGGIVHRAVEATYEAVDYPLSRFGATQIVSQSEKIARAVRQVYHRDSEVITFALAEDDGILSGGETSIDKFARMDRDGVQLIQVGQLAKDKNPGLSLDVVEALRERIPRVRLSFVGDGTLRAALEAEVRHRRLADRVFFLGFKNEHELAEIYTKAHMLLFPGDHQAFGIVPIEAIWKSVVPIVVKNAGVADILRRHGLTTVAKRTAADFAAQAWWVYAHRATIGEWLSGVRESLKKELSYDNFLDQYERCFAACLEANGEK